MVDFKKRLDHFFSYLIQAPHFHGRFLNTLSLLEYVGARKMLKSQLASSIDFSILDHMEEEIRHARVFKKLSLKVSFGELTDYREDYLYCGREGVAYFQKLDRECAQILGPEASSLNYFYTTLLIEERANELYPLYEGHLRSLGLAGHLRAIIRQEEGHLDQVLEVLRKDSQFEERVTFLRHIESNAFNEFLTRLEDQMEGLYQQSLPLFPRKAIESNYAVV